MNNQLNQIFEIQRNQKFDQLIEEVKTSFSVTDVDDDITTIVENYQRINEANGYLIKLAGLRDLNEEQVYRLEKTIDLLKVTIETYEENIENILQKSHRYLDLMFIYTAISFAVICYNIFWN